MTREIAVGPEAALLFTCVRGRADEAAIRAQVRKGIDWAAFLSFAERHGLSSLCCRRLEQAAAELVPAVAMERLRGRLRVDAERNLFLTGELFRILDKLGDGGVKALAFKGPVLGWWLYGHPGLRRFSDLDLLVEERELPHAIALLADLGYCAERDGAGQVKMVRSTGQLSLLRTAPAAEVDLHWNLAPRAMALPLDARSLLPRSMTVKVGRRPVLTFGTEDQLLLSAFHGAKHGWTNLAWLADLSALAETREPDWPRLVSEARRKQISHALFAGLGLAHELLGTPVPAEIRKPLQRDRAAAAMRAEARAFLLEGAARRAIFPRELRYELWLTEGWARKAGYFWRKITEPSAEDYEFTKTARPFRLMRKYAFRLAGLH